jgi:hypothetical protein
MVKKVMRERRYSAASGGYMRPMRRSRGSGGIGGVPARVALPEFLFPEPALVLPGPWLLPAAAAPPRGRCLKLVAA